MHLLPSVRQVSLVAGGVTASIGAIGLLGWVLDVDVMKEVFPGLPFIRRNSATALIALGIAIMLLRPGSPPRQQSVGRLLALLCAAFGALTLVKYAGGFALEEHLYADDPLDARPSPVTGVMLILVSSCLLLVDAAGPRHHPFKTGLAAAGVALVAAIIGYLYDVDFLRGGTEVSGLSLSTLAAMTSALVGLLWLRPDRDVVGFARGDATYASLARLLLPAAFVVPILAGLLAFAGDSGQLFDLRIGTALGALLTVVAFFTVIGYVLIRLRAAEREAASAEARSRRIFELSADMLAVANTDGYFVDLNPAWTETLGYSEEELRSRPFVDYVHAEDRESTAAEASKLAKGGETVDFENRYIAKDGSVRWLEWRSRLAEDGLIYARASDISHRKLTDDIVRGLLESAPDPMVVVDARGTITLANAEAGRGFGYDEAELVGQPVEILVPERLRERFVDQRAAYATDAAARSVDSALDLYVLRKDGSEIPVEIRLSPLETPDGSFLVAAIRDVSERREAQRRLEAAAEELERSNTELRQFAYIASHDLNEPLRTIAGFAQLLEKRYSDEVDERGRDYIRRMIGGVERMQALIADLLSYSRVGRGEMADEPVDVGAVVATVIDDLTTRLEERKAVVEVDGLPVVMGDEGRLRQLFQNLISNAVKFNENPGGRVEVGAQRLDSRWRIWVADNGIGIPEEHRERVFAAFQRLHGRDDYSGTGIGLAICRRIVERHGGKIWIEDGLDGRGSRFVVELPVTEGR